MKRSISPLLILLFFGLSAQTLFADETIDQPPTIATEIADIISAKQHPYLLLKNFRNRSSDLESFYNTSNNQLVWLGNVNSEKNINNALILLESASEHGLNPENYDAEYLHQQLQLALNLAPNSFREQALYDTAISLSLLRFLHDLHYGRVIPQGVNFNLKLREKKLLDLPSLIKNSLLEDTLTQLPQKVEPELKQYRLLKQALASYRELAKKIPPFTLNINKTLRPGNKHIQVPELRNYLIGLGDLPENETDSNLKNPTLYDDRLAKGIKIFQQRHGLNADGHIGKNTVAALNTPMSQRVIQIELAMERLRWLPKLDSGASIIVNIPAFQLWAFEDIDQPDSNVLNMRVVVGKAFKNQTPVLMAEMHFIDFMPYWNVPRSILKKEIVPKLLQNNDYLDQENMELVAVDRSISPPDTSSIDAITLLKQGKLRVRQRPGRKNALGKVKFIFPNKEDVYLHDTPSVSLFNKSRRDLSHGCVRVAAPEALAEFALKDQDNWNEETIRAAMNRSRTQRVVLKKPIPVLFFYTTAFIDQFGKIQFYPDIYGFDPILLTALSKADDLSDQFIFASNNNSENKELIE